MATNTTSKFKKVRLFKASKELNITTDAIVDYLTEKGYAEALAGKGLNASITDEEAYEALLEEFAADRATRERVREKRLARQAEAEAEAAAEAQAEAAAEAAADDEDVVAEPESVPTDGAADAAEEPAAETPAPEPEAPAAEEPETPAAPADKVVSVPEDEAVEPAAEPPAAEPDAEPAAASAEPAAADEAPPAPEADVPAAEAPEAEAPAAKAPEAAAPEAETPAAETPAAKTPAAETPAAKTPAAKTPDEKAPAAEQPAPTEAADEESEQAEGEDAESTLKGDRYKLTGTKVLGKVDLSAIEDKEPRRKRKRKRKSKAASTSEGSVEISDSSARKPDKKKKRGKRGVDEQEVEQTLQDTLRELEMGASRARQRRRRRRRDTRAEEREREAERRAEDEKVLRVTEYVSTGELANLMDVSVTDVIKTLFSAGMIVSINQRLDADTITIVADEYGYDVDFITDVAGEDLVIEEDDPEDLRPRAPVVTVMGHVDHGKTSLLDRIRKANVVAGEAGGITQHIGAYHVEMADERKITFLDTPGHEAFTAMRARGAQVTDIVILVVAADDAVMPQTVEAINHAKAAEVPMVVAVNKIDKPDSNPQRVMQQLSEEGVLVEPYGGNVQCAFVSAVTGEGVDELMEKVLLEAELKELQANPDRNAVGTIIESRLEKGRGNVATVLVQNGTLKVGDIFVAGIHSGRVRAMFDERDQRVNDVGPARPVLVIGFDGAPEVGDQFVVLDEEREARDIASNRQQIFREQSLRQRKHITLDEIGRRLALGDFQELNLIIKADVGGSVGALGDSLLKLSTEEVAVNIIHDGVGAITESDVMLASASDAVIIGFQVRPTAGARQLAEREEIDVRTYSIIYNAIEDVRDALEGLLSPEQSEKTIGVAEVRETFKVPRVGTVAGCYVTEGRLHRNDKVRLIREGVVTYDGKLSSLKRFKDDVREVQSGYECGLGIENYNDLKVGDQIEAYEIVETKRTLER